MFRVEGLEFRVEFRVRNNGSGKALLDQDRPSFKDFPSVVVGNQGIEFLHYP